MLLAPSSKPTEDKVEWVRVPVVIGERSFDEEREAELSEIFQQSAEQLRRHTAEWQQTVKRMRDNFVKLHPVDAEHPALMTAGDSEKIRTLFFEYPPDSGEDRALSASASTPSAKRPLPTRYQVRFDVSDFLPTSVTVTAELSTIVVRAAGASADQHRAAQVPLALGVQRRQLRAFLSVDGVLTVEAPLIEGEVEASRTTSIDDDEDAGSSSKWKQEKSTLVKAEGKTFDAAENLCNGNTNTNDKVNGVTGNEADASKNSTSPADTTSPTEGQTGASSKEKVGVPIFRDELGTRRMYLAVELGTTYRPRDVIIQVTAAGGLFVKGCLSKFLTSVLLKIYLKPAHATRF